MTKLWPVLAAMCPMLYASSLAQTACGVGTETWSPCPNNDGDPYVEAGAMTIVDDIDARNGGPAYIRAAADAEVRSPEGADVQLFATAEAEVDITYVSPGTFRAGFIQFTPAFDTESANAPSPFADLSFTDGVHLYGPGSGGPALSTILPFDLGTGFQVSATATAQAYYPDEFLSTQAVAQSSFSALTFMLLDSDGVTPVPFFEQAVVVPEPTSFALMLLGMAVCVGYVSACGVQKSRTGLHGNGVKGIQTSIVSGPRLAQA